MPGYKQSGLSYEYYNAKGESMEPKYSSGLIENEKNIWLHPFRRPVYFAVLNLNPYPFVRYPLKKGDEYTWELEVGGTPYSVPHWKEWEGTTVRKFEYRVIGRERKDYSFGQNLEVFHVLATATSEIGNSSAEFWFSEKFGFVEMLYINIDSTKFHFELERVEEPIKGKEE